MKNEIIGHGRMPTLYGIISMYLEKVEFTKSADQNKIEHEKLNTLNLVTPLIKV